MNKSKLAIIVRISVSLFLLGLLLWLARENLTKIKQLLASVNLSIFTLAFLLFLSSIVFMAWRLKIALSVQQTSFSMKDSFPLTLIGYFFANFMPTSVGGDLVKGYYIAQKIKSKMASYTSIFVDRIIGMFSLALIATIAIVFFWGDIKYGFIFWMIIVLLILCTGLILLLYNKEMLKKIGDYSGLARLLQILKLDALAKKTYSAVNVYKNRKKNIFQMCILSLAAQLFAFYAIFLLSISLSAEVPFTKIILTVPVIFVLCMLPITMNGLGLREWGFVFFFSSNIGKAAAFSLSLLYLAMFLIVSLIGGVVYLFWR